MDSQKVLANFADPFTAYSVHGAFVASIVAMLVAGHVTQCAATCGGRKSIRKKTAKCLLMAGSVCRIIRNQCTDEPASCQDPVWLAVNMFTKQFKEVWNSLFFWLNAKHRLRTGQHSGRFFGREYLNLRPLS